MSSVEDKPAVWSQSCRDSVAVVCGGSGNVVCLHHVLVTGCTDTLEACCGRWHPWNKLLDHTHGGRGWRQPWLGTVAGVTIVGAGLVLGHCCLASLEAPAVADINP